MTAPCLWYRASTETSRRQHPASPFFRHCPSFHLGLSHGPMAHGSSLIRSSIPFRDRLPEQDQRVCGLPVLPTTNRGRLGSSTHTFLRRKTLSGVTCWTSHPLPPLRAMLFFSCSSWLVDRASCAWSTSPVKSKIKRLCADDQNSQFLRVTAQSTCIFLRPFLSPPPPSLLFSSRQFDGLALHARPRLPRARSTPIVFRPPGLQISTSHGFTAYKHFHFFLFFSLFPSAGSQQRQGLSNVGEKGTKSSHFFPPQSWYSRRLSCRPHADSFSTHCIGHATQGPRDSASGGHNFSAQATMMWTFPLSSAIRHTQPRRGTSKINCVRTRPPLPEPLEESEVFTHGHFPESPPPWLLCLLTFQGRVPVVFGHSGARPCCLRGFRGLVSSQRRRRHAANRHAARLTRRATRCGQVWDLDSGDSLARRRKLVWTHTTIFQTAFSQSADQHGFGVHAAMRNTGYCAANSESGPPFHGFPGEHERKHFDLGGVGTWRVGIFGELAKC